MTSTYWGVQLVEIGAVAGARLSFHPSPETIVRPGAREIVRSRSGGGRPQSYPMVRLFGPFHIFVSCTSMRSATVLDEMERRTGKCVVTALQPTVWHLLGLAGALRDVPGLGSLFALKAGVAEA